MWGGEGGQRCAKLFFCMCFFLNDARFCVFFVLMCYPFRFLCSYDFYRASLVRTSDFHVFPAHLELIIHWYVALPWRCWIFLLLFQVNVLFISLLWSKNEKLFFLGVCVSIQSLWFFMLDQGRTKKSTRFHTCMSWQAQFPKTPLCYLECWRGLLQC